MPVTSVNPAIELVLPAYNSSGSLSGNLDVFKKRLHRKIFMHEMNASQYSVVVNSEGINITFAGSSQNEQSTVNKVSERSKNLAGAIADEIIAWLGASKRDLQVKVPHGFDQNSHTALNNIYFTIEKGGSSTPKGLEI
jgi:hypothetical protein